MGLFTPDFYFSGICKITPQFLKEHNITSLVLDIDNTLTGHSSQELSAEIEGWLNTMKSNGIKMMIASNNYEKRVRPFAEKIGLEFVSFSCKPSPVGFIKARKRFGVSKKNMALIGDQIFTDTIGAKLYGITMLLTKPIYDDFIPTIVLKRKLEQPIIKAYLKKGGKML